MRDRTWFEEVVWVQCCLLDPISSAENSSPLYLNGHTPSKASERPIYPNGKNRRIAFLEFPFHQGNFRVAPPILREHYDAEMLLHWHGLCGRYANNFVLVPSGSNVWLGLLHG